MFVSTSWWISGTWSDSNPHQTSLASSVFHVVFTTSCWCYRSPIDYLYLYYVSPNPQDVSDADRTCCECRSFVLPHLHTSGGSQHPRRSSITCHRWRMRKNIDSPNFSYKNGLVLKKLRCFPNRAGSEITLVWSCSGKMVFSRRHAWDMNITGITEIDDQR